ncbi:oxidoreductase [Streptomyces asiaticus]|uniref:oxidoreductase n=1 Tax=Streptomyces asiaticus TaxID=114695 RepID=UPI0039BE2B03
MPGRRYGAPGMELDVTDEHAVRTVVDRIERGIGPIDVLISNAGYGVEGTVEESSMDDLRRQFDVNVYGTVAAIRAVLPYLRHRRGGHIVTLSSMAGLTALPGVAFYGASKFAIEGISASLAQEVAQFGIHVTSLALGSFRTDWAGRSMVRVPRTIPDYDAVFEPIRAARKAKDGNQTGDPARAAKALLTVLDAEDPPVHLVLGSDALRLIEQGRQRLLEVRKSRLVDITWHVMSLAVLNETRVEELPEHIRDLMDRAWAPVRTLIAAQIAFGADALEPLYTALGTRYHLNQEPRTRATIEAALGDAGCPPTSPSPPHPASTRSSAAVPSARSSTEPRHLT